MCFLFANIVNYSVLFLLYQDFLSVFDVDASKRFGKRQRRSNARFILFGYSLYSSCYVSTTITC